MIRKNITAWTMAITLGLATLAGAGTVSAAGTYVQEPTGGEMFADLVVARPMILIASAVGLVGWVVTLPFSIPSGDAGKIGQEWVLDPLQYTFVRPVGNLDPKAVP